MFTSSVRYSSRFTCASLIAAGLVAVLAACGGGGEGAAPASTGSPSSGIPGPVAGGSTPDLPPGGTPPAPAPGGTPPMSAALRMFVDTTYSTSNARIAVDPAGGKHAAFAYYEPNVEQRPTSAVYRYCASVCENADSWQEVRMGTLVRSVQLKLTPQGKPRLMFAADSTVYTGGLDHFYATCDTGCGQAAAWTVTRVFSGRVPAYNLDNDDQLPQRSFALDAEGRPRFVVFDENQLAEPQHFGLYYMTCDTGCSDAHNWGETLISVVQRYAVERASQPALAISPDGRPRVTSAQFFALNSNLAVLMYLACEQACDRSANWGRAELMPRGGGSEPSADIAVDAQGRPRIAFYQEALLEGQGKRLHYLACDDGCLDPARWSIVDLGLGFSNGQEPDLELDVQGRPRIAYSDWDSGGIGYAWCDQNCAGGSANWQHKLLEQRAALYDAWPVAYPFHCDGGLWNTLTPTLSLPADGPAQIAFDAIYNARCWYDDTTDSYPPTSEMHQIKRAARLLTVE
jgi:hypothetical protein